MRRRRAATGFTLIELLVVISIIALLIAILLPALGAAKDFMRTLNCRSNLRQVAVGMTTYTTDWKGTLPRYRSGDSWWVNVMVGNDYITAPDESNGFTDEKSVMRCPNGIELPATKSGGAPTGHSDRYPPTQSHNDPSGWHRGWHYHYKKINSATSISETNGVGVRSWYMANSAKRFPTPFQYDNSNTVVKIDEVGTPSMLVGIMEGAWELHDYHGTRIAARHGPFTVGEKDASVREGDGMCNMVFMDGHVNGVETDWLYNGDMNTEQVQHEHGVVFNADYAD